MSKKADQFAPKTITLSKPVDVDGKPAETLTMREPFVADQMAAEEMAGDNRALMEVTMYANLCSVPVHVIQGLRIKDYKQLTAAYVDFTN